MKPKGEREDDIRMLLESIETLAANYDKLSHAKPFRIAAEVSADMALIRHGRILDVVRKRVRQRRSRRQNRRMKAAMTSRAKTTELQTAAPGAAVKEYFSDARIAVFTALFGGYDDIRDPLVHPDNIDYFIITDQQLDEESCWRRLPADLIPADVEGDIARNRWVKMHPHLLFPNYDYSIYLDSNCWVVSDLTPLIATLGSFPVAMFPHKNRDCVYDEVEACLLQRKDRRSALEEHRQVLVDHGVAHHAGLAEATVIARRHHDPASVELMDRWWQEFAALSNRDQIALADCLWQMGTPVARLTTLQDCGCGRTVPECCLFLLLPHRLLPRG